MPKDVGRNYLTENEVERIIAACAGAYKARNQALILIAFRHGLRASEAVELRWTQINLDDAILHVGRLKNGTPSTHFLSARETRLLRRLKKEQDQPGAFVFVSRKGGPLTRQHFGDILRKAALAARIDVPAHPHMLRHGCGFHLANNGRDTRSLQDYLGHKQIQNTIKYTKMSPQRFRDFWPD